MHNHCFHEKHNLPHTRKFGADSHVSPVHRLGVGTSGVLLCAKTEHSRKELARQFRDKEVTKVYRAIVCGLPPEDLFSISVPITQKPYPMLGFLHVAACTSLNPSSDSAQSPDSQVEVSSNQSPATELPSLSHCRILTRSLVPDSHTHDNSTDKLVCWNTQHHSLVEVQIPTGRPHQIRIHMAYSGFPLHGDPLYAPGGEPTMKLPDGSNGRLALPRDGGSVK
eukprot:c3957_g1_i1.p1 GENE.c3957_g1_i1~~c3957_g1_i1.p1  ORF type:complete len:223 (+),score=32.07 c3957_g1_i1:298-966(+)